jgi:excisionase family DNA binding protein
VATGGKNDQGPSSVMTDPQVCEFLRVHPNTIYRLLKAKKIPSFRIGSEHRFTRQAIDEWV